MHGEGGCLNMKNIKIWPTSLIPTLQKHITTKHSNIMNLVVMYIFSLPHWVTDAAMLLFFWRGIKTYFSSPLMMLISSQSKTCKWNVCTQLSKLFYGSGKGSHRTKCLGGKKREGTQLVTSADFVSILRSIYWLVTHEREPQIYDAASAH